MIKFVPLKIRSLQVVECTGVLGDGYIFKLPISGYLNEISNISMWVEGTLQTSILSSDAISKLYIESKPFRNPGDTSIDDKHLKFGSFTIKYTCITDTFKYYCVRTKDNTNMYNAKVEKLLKGDSLTIPANSKNFIAIGTVEYNNETYTAPTEILKTENTTIKVISDKAVILLV